jgi:hypothetical protein
MRFDLTHDLPATFEAGAVSRNTIGRSGRRMVDVFGDREGSF